MTKIEHTCASLQDVLDAFFAMPDVSAKAKQETSWALRRFAKLVSPAGLSQPVDLMTMKAALKETTPAAVGLKLGSFRNMISRVRRALLVTGLLKHPGKHRGPLQPEWEEFRSHCLHGQTFIGMSRFLHYASDAGWQPEEVSDAHIERFEHSVRHEALHMNPATLLKTTVACWNKTIARIPGWSGAPLSPPEFRRDYTLPWAVFDDGLIAEIEGYLREQAASETFEDVIASLADDLENWDATCELGAENVQRVKAGRRRSARGLATSTAKLRHTHIHQYLSAVIHQAGIDPRSVRSLGQALQPEFLKAGFSYHYHRAGQRMHPQLQSIAIALLGIAKYHLRDNVTEARIRGLLQRIRTELPRRFSEKKAKRLRQFDDPINLRKLLKLPIALEKKAQQASLPLAAAEIMKAAVALELLAFTALRGGNLVSIQIGHNLVQVSPSRFHLVFPPQEVKNRQPLEFELTTEASQMLERYLREFRPQLPGAASKWLFPTAEGHEDRRNFSSRLTRIVRRETGFVITPHMYRSIGPEQYLLKNPDGLALVSTVLGHTNLETARRHYVRANERRSRERYAQAVLQARRRPAAARATTIKQEDVL
jgi:integrase